VILNEARKGYDAIVMGATERKRSKGVLFNLLVDRVLQDSPCATMVVKSNLPLPDDSSRTLDRQPIRHILVPTIGNEYSRNAVEVGSTIAAQTGALVTLVHVVTLPQVEYILFDQQTLEPAMEIARQIVEQEDRVASSLGAEVKTQVLTGKNPEREILTFARDRQVDLIILGSNVRTIAGRVFYGHLVDAILSKAHCPVVLVTSS
jgi:nucleotide-binding universal stress UspA family protein